MEDALQRASRIQLESPQSRIEEKIEKGQANTHEKNTYYENENTTVVFWELWYNMLQVNQPVIVCYQAYKAEKG